MTLMPQPVNTAKVEGFRTLRFESLEDLLWELDRIEQSHRSGTLKQIGNWSPGRIFGHLAAWINYAYEGFPRGAHPPFFIRWIIKRQKAKYLRHGMPRGVKIPAAPDGTFGTDQMDFDAGMRKLRAAIGRLQAREPVKFHSPAFGQMSDDDRIAMQMRHAELHLGYLIP